MSAVKQKKFREDLFYRFDMFPIHLPPLRERPGDISFLAKKFIHQFSRKYNKHIHEISEESIHYIEHYSWPGNVRELKNVIQRACIICNTDSLKPEHLNSRLLLTKKEQKFQISPNMTLADIEKQVIETLLSLHPKGEVAKILAISRKTLYNKIKKYKLDVL